MQERTSESHQDEEHLSSGPAIPPEEVEAELRRILASPIFRKAPRHSRFLNFVVRKALEGPRDSVKEYLIGLEVFDRETDYDPGSDPVVRVEAGRLRSRLADYYLKVGRHDPIHIALPKGTYVPLFYRNGIGPSEALESALDGSAENVTVIPGARPTAVPQLDRRRRRIWRWAIAGVLCVLVAGYVVYALRVRKARAIASALADKPLVVADFTNTTGESIFDDTLRQGLSAQLEQSPFLNLLSDQQVAQTLSLMGQPKDARLTHPLAREVCLRTSSVAVVEGSIATRGSQYLLGLRAVSCADGDLLADVGVTAERKDQVLQAMGKAATKLRTKLGESLASVQKYDVPAEGVTTSSLEALQAYTLGCRAKNFWGDFATAASLFQRAISLDRNFAMAYAQLGTIYANQSEDAGAEENLRKAYELRERVSLQEKFYVESHYHHLLTGDLQGARTTYELWAQTYPRDWGPSSSLGNIYGMLGDHSKALTAFQQAVEFNPTNGMLYANLVLGYMEMNRLDEAQAAALDAQAHNLDPPLLHLNLYFVDFLQHNEAGMEREAAGLMAKPGWGDWMLYAESNTAAYAGRFAEAREFVRRAVEYAEHGGEKELAATYTALAAVHEALVGNKRLAKQQAQAALLLSKHNEVIPALALALAGDSGQVTRLAEDLASQRPKNTVWQFNYLPTIRAAVALQKGDGAKAIEALAPALPYELGDVAYLGLYPIYVRGNAYLVERQGTAAAAEFQKILDHPGVAANDPIGALAHLGLGRAYALSGDTDKAKVAYQDFLALWKDADPDIPIYKQAKAEYARLK